MEITYFNGKFIPKNEVRISPDDRGFLFADGIYEVIRWYKGFFYDMESHITRLRRSLEEVRIQWSEADSFPHVAEELIRLNNLQNLPSIVYLQVTRGEAKRTHAFPSPPVNPTVYAYAGDFVPDSSIMSSGISVILMKDIRWSRCNIKSVSLLPNILCFQEAREAGCFESVFVRNGLVTEGSHSNIFFVIDDILFTHPESDHILSGITRKNVLRIARESGIKAIEAAVSESRLAEIREAFITNTSAEITAVTSIGKMRVGTGTPGPLTRLISEKFIAEVSALKG